MCIYYMYVMYILSYIDITLTYGMTISVWKLWKVLKTWSYSDADAEVFGAMACGCLWLHWASQEPRQGGAARPGSVPRPVDPGPLHEASEAERGARGWLPVAHLPARHSGKLHISGWYGELSQTASLRLMHYPNFTQISTILYNTNMTKRDFPRPRRTGPSSVPTKPSTVRRAKAWWTSGAKTSKGRAVEWGGWTAEREDRMTYEFHDFGRFNVFPWFFCFPSVPS